MSLKLLISAVVVAGVVAAGLGVVLLITSDGSGSAARSAQDVSDSLPSAPGGAGSAAARQAEDAPGGGSLEPVQPGPLTPASRDVCGSFHAFYALRSKANENASARDADGQTQRNQSTQRSTTRSRSQVTINGVVVQDTDIDVTAVNRSDGSGSGSSQSTSVSTSTTVSASGTHERVVVNGEVIKDERTTDRYTRSGLTAVITNVVAKWVQLESKLILNWYASALAGPSCNAGAP